MKEGRMKRGEREGLGFDSVFRVLGGGVMMLWSGCV
jgi:hypothetical protein